MASCCLKVMLAVDGSDHSLAAVDLLGSLPVSPASEIRVLAVLLPRDASGFAGLEQVLMLAKARLETLGWKVTTELLTGSPAEQLSEYAGRYRPDLIVMGARGRRAAVDIPLGGVAQQLVEYAACPVLVVRHPFQSLRQILLVTDGSAGSWHAAEVLAGLPPHPPFLIGPQTAITVLHVLPPPPLPMVLTRAWAANAEYVPTTSSPVMEAALLEQAQLEEREGQKLLAATLDCLAANGIQAASRMLRGDAAAEIIEYARAHPTDLIVTGSRGLSPMRSWLLGSVSRKLAHYAGCSVLIVK